MTSIPAKLPQNFYTLHQMMTSPEQLLNPFAVTDLFIQETAQTESGFLHFWETIPLVILGMKDTRVPNLNLGLKTLHNAGFQTIARNSGGLAVVSDPGVINFSLVLPNQASAPISVTTGYELMTQLIQTTFASYTDKIEAKEIATSYCPGEFDLSIDGKKFAGISQRRIGSGLAVMIYLSINGDQIKRGKTIRDFYQMTLKEDFGSGGYPAVAPSSMANINTLLNQNFSTSEVADLIKKTATTLFSTETVPLDWGEYLNQPAIKAQYDKHLVKMQSRNQDILEMGEANYDTL